MHTTVLHSDSSSSLPSELMSQNGANAVSVDLAVIVPTLNEAANVPVLVQKLRDVLGGIAWEVVFVDDDSPDGTADVVRAIARTDARIRCVQRIGRRGLSSACIEGVLITAAPFIAVMDADLQHDEALLPLMFRAVRDEDLDLAVGSRYVAGGSVGTWERSRARMSNFGTRLARSVTRAEVADPMSGFFVIRRAAFMDAVRNLSGQGFKILLDLLASSSRPLRLREFGYTFRPRRHGESKLDSMVAWEYLMLIADKLVGHVVPVRFALFAGIGILGVVVNLIVLRLGWLAGLPFGLAGTGATFAAMVSNFLLNNHFTYRDRRLRGWRKLRGLATFCIGCSVGAVANVGIAEVLAGNGRGFWPAAIAGAVIGGVWNYAIASTYTWGRTRS